MSHRAWWLHAVLIGQLILLPCPMSRGVWVEVDSDGDGVMDSGYENGVVETGGESLPLLPEPDADGDRLSDAEEAALGSDPFNPDSDHDGLTDADEVQLTGTSPLLADSNGDGITDYNAFYGNSAVDTLWAGQGSTPYDWDGDGLHDPVDPDPYSARNIGDADGDHVPDPEDSHPLDPALWCDRNGNAVNDDAEMAGADWDGDGTSDATDSHPADPNLDNDWNANGRDDEHEDGDGDGVSNLQDSHPNANTLWCDWNGNGVNDDAEAAAAAGDSILANPGPAAFDTQSPADAVLQDRDGDGYADDRDTHPDDPGLWNDHNGNRLNDDAESPPDTDRDGVPDVRDAAPTDHDNDGLTDAEEWIRGTNAAEADSDGDGLGDGEEVHLATDPRGLDSDGDGLTDSEEVLAYHSNPLEPTAIAETESLMASTPAEAPSLAATALRVSQILPAAAAATGQRRVEYPDGGGLAFPSRSAQKDKSDLAKTLLLACPGDTPIVGLSARLTGANAAHFRLGSLSGAELTPGTERELTVSFLAPLPANQVCTATLTLHGGPEARPLFVLQLRSVVSTGLWLTHDEYFFADYTDSDLDGIPDLVEEMYAPLQVTATGDLDGDGVNNLDQYLAGRDLRDRAQSTDVDGDGLSNAVEDAWNAAYPGRLNRFYFADAFADPDADGLLTVEELNGLWGGLKDAHAVVTHPFLAASPPPTVSKTATYKTAGRKPPKTPPAAGTAQTPSGPLPGRCSRYAAWMHDGLLRRASHETALANGGRLPADFFSAERVVHAATAALQHTQGSDHLPRGYLAWLARQTPAILVPAPAPGVPADPEVRQLAALCWPDAADPDADTLPTAWEAAHELNWRDAADSHVEQAIAGLNRQAAALNEQDSVQLAEQEALLQVRDQLTAAASTWPVTVYPTAGGSRSTLLVPVYAVAEVAFPAALKASPATTWASRREVWLGRQVEALHWQVLARLDPDHDGLMNIDEHRHGLNPRLPDYNATSERDTDGDGFTDAMELATGTDHLKKTSKPVYAIEILTPVAERSVTALQTLAQPLRLQTVLKGSKGGIWPIGGQTLSVSAPDNHTLLAWEETGRGLSWQPKTVPAGVTNAQGIAVLQVHPGWKGPTLNLTLKSTPGPGCPAGVRAATVTCPLKILPPEGDKDADAMTDVWEIRPANQGQPAHGLAAASPLDATASPLHFGYHPATPPERLPAVVQELLNEWKAAEADLGYLPEYPATSAIATVLAVPTTEEATLAARHKILALIDPDHDGWSNLEEFERGSHPQVPDNPATATRDTDGDGVPDVLERQEGTNPLDAGSVPVQTLAEVSLRGIWGSGQSVPPNTLAPQPIVVQLFRGKEALSKRVALDATCVGGSFALPAVENRNVQWQAGSQKLVTDAQGKAVFHFWTPAHASSSWQIHVAVAGQPGIGVRLEVHNAGGTGSGAASGGPAAGDRKPSAGQSLGFDSSHAPFVIRFENWKGGVISHMGSGGVFEGGSLPYKARVQKKRWELRFGSPVIVNDGPAQDQDIGNHTAESAEAWQSSQTQPTPAYQVKVYQKEWISGDEGGGWGSAYYELFEENPEVAARQLLERFTLANWVESTDYQAYETPAVEYHLLSGQWQVVEAVWPLADQDSGGQQPVEGDENPVKHYFQHLAPETFSHAGPVNLDLRRQAVQVLNSQDAERRIQERGVVIPVEKKRVPNKLDKESEAMIATGRSSLRQTTYEGGQRAYTAIQSKGSLRVEWDTAYPVALSETSRAAWLQRFLVLRTERTTRDGVEEPVVTTQALPLSQFLSLTASESSPLDLDPGPLETGTDKTVTLSLVTWDLAIDANRDGTIAEGETASQERPFRFWINEDHDSAKNEGENVKGDKDNADDVIANERDLEDFQLLRFAIPESLLRAAKAGKAHIGLKWKTSRGDTPSIKVYRARQGIQNPNHYLWNADGAELQVQGSRYNRAMATIAGTIGVPLPHDLMYYSADGFGYTGDPFLLFEGVTGGSGQLCLVIRLEGGATIEGPGPWLDLCSIRKMYVKNHESEFERPPMGTESPEVLTFVHGWNMSPEGASVFAETLFKRLWHKGFRGRFAAFRWNTDWSDAFDNVPGVGEPLEAYLADYNGSELIAWKSGLALKNFVNLRPSSYRAMLVAHSMGNIVAGSALSQGLNVGKYVLLQAAVPASCYDDSMELRESETRKQNIDWLLDPTMWDEWSADDDYDPESYRGKLMNIGGNPTSFYQPEDVATSYAWEINNDLTKPPGLLAGNNTYRRDRSPGNRCLYIIQGLQELPDEELELDGFQALTKSCRSWSKAVGAQGATRGSIRRSVNNDDMFEFEDEHSAEFNRNIQRLSNFYEVLKSHLAIETP